MSKFAQTAIPHEFKRGWKVLVDGKEIVAGKVELVSHQWGHLTYGLRPEGYDSWTYKMRTNAVTIPYAIEESPFAPLLLVGLINEDRQNMGGKNLCVIGGFTDPDETIEEAEAREKDEESGLAGKAKPIGDQMVTDRLFWNATEEGFGGNITFAQRIPINALVQVGLEDVWRLRQGSMTLANFRKAQSLIFLEWSDAVMSTKDGVALSALARLRAAFDQGKL